MSSNVGLTTPRGSAPYPKDFEAFKHRQRQPDKEILEHDRRREIEVKVFELRDKLEDEDVEEDDIDAQCAALRSKLESEQLKKDSNSKGKALKSHQVHELAQAKIQESEKLRKALRISKDYEEGSHWKRAEKSKDVSDKHDIE